MTHLAALLTLVLDVLIVVLAVYLLRSGREAVVGANKAVYAVRKFYAAGLFLVLASTLAFTLTKTPYKAFGQERPAVVVEVTGRMWQWQLGAQGAGPLEVPANRLVEFAVTAADVNHGFGVYDDQGNLIAQTQAMPGYTNRLRMVFPRPGTYHVLCMEYCGTIHHTMVSSFTVV